MGVAIAFPPPPTLRCADPTCEAVRRPTFSLARTKRLALGSRFTPETDAGTRVEVVPSGAAEVDGMAVEPASVGTSTLLVWADDELETWMDLDVVEAASLYVASSTGSATNRLRLSLSKQPSARLAIRAVDEDGIDLDSYLPADVTFAPPGIARVELRAEGRFVVADAVGRSLASIRVGSGTVSVEDVEVVVDP